jgi:L-arabinose transport system ATP-binding protein
MKDNSPGQPEAHPVVFEALNVAKRFGPVAALSGASIQLRAGEVVALMGENGAGKSTLLKILTGDHASSSGALLLGGREVTFRDPAHARRMGVRVVAQEPEIAPDVTVAENIYIGALRQRGRRYSRSLLEREAGQELAEHGFGSSIDPGMLGKDLTAAQRQIVEIMRALQGSPKVICFDEPTSSLGEHEVDILFRLVAELRRRRVAIAYVSHRLPEVFELADRVTVLRDGTLVGSRQITETSSDELVRMMVGRDLSQLFERTPHQPGEPILQLDSVTTDDVHGVKLSVRRGEVVGIAGLVGAGRSELLRAIVGDIPVRSGSIAYKSRPITFKSPADSIAVGIGFAPEERKAEALILERSISDNIVLTVLPKISRAGFVLARRERTIASGFISRMRIRTPSPDQLVKRLSGGNQQKVVLARWLAIAPDLLLLDEPTRGVDVGAKAEIYRIIDGLAAQGTAVIVVSSELPELMGLSDRIYVMAHGRLSSSLNRADATEERILSLALTDDAAPREPAPTSDRNEGLHND